MLNTWSALLKSTLQSSACFWLVIRNFPFLSFIPWSWNNIDCETLLASVDLTKLTDKQSDYINVPKKGPFKDDTYRY